jgi:hypothetical protein
MEVIAPVIALVVVVCIVTLLLSAAVWLIVFTRVVRWTFYAVVAFLCLRLVLLPFQSGTRMLDEEIRSKVDVTFTTTFGQGRYFDKFSLNTTGTITNHSDRRIRRIFIACRVPKLAFGWNETTGNHFSVVVGPGETKTFGGVISDRLTGVDKAGYKSLQPPDQHFCRLDGVYAG